MANPAENTQAAWKVPQCPFTVEYTPRVLDDIRLAVVDAFYSLPRGGAEIGGILLGTHQDRRVRILEALPLECEHAFGPSFTLSAADQAKLSEQLPALARGANVPVGWYHSHTRSGIFLSGADLEIYQRFFPERWQVALVLRPHAFEPMRAGFFFREADGSIHAPESYREFALDPLPSQPVTSAHAAPAPALHPAPLAPWLRAQLEDTPVARPSSPAELPPSAPQPEPERPPIVEPPKFTTVHHSRSKRMMAFLAVLLGITMGAGGYQTRDRWLPRVRSLGWGVSPASATPAVIGLRAVDSGGQLLILWDHDSAIVRQGTGGLLMIVDGTAAPVAMGLGTAHLQSGSFTYARQSGQVQVMLTVHQPDGTESKEVTTYLGQPPDRTPPEEVDARKKREEQLHTDLKNQVQRTRKLEKSLEEMRLEMQRGRTESEIPVPEKK